MIESAEEEEEKILRITRGREEGSSFSSHLVRLRVCGYARFSAYVWPNTTFLISSNNAAAIMLPSSKGGLRAYSTQTPLCQIPYMVVACSICILPRVPSLAKTQSRKSAFHWSVPHHPFLSHPFSAPPFRWQALYCCLVRNVECFVRVLVTDISAGCVRLLASYRSAALWHMWYCRGKQSGRE